MRGLEVGSKQAGEKQTKPNTSQSLAGRIPRAQDPLSASGLSPQPWTLKSESKGPIWTPKMRKLAAPLVRVSLRLKRAKSATLYILLGPK